MVNDSQDFTFSLQRKAISSISIAFCIIFWINQCLKLSPGRILPKGQQELPVAIVCPSWQQVCSRLAYLFRTDGNHITVCYGCKSLFHENKNEKCC